MAATGKTPILLYGSTTATNVPVAGNLTNSSDGCEIAINVADKNLFFKDSTNAVNTVPIRQSSASSNGWLSSTDWSTFNSKVSSQWVTTGSNIYYSTGSVGVGVSPVNTLQVYKASVAAVLSAGSTGHTFAIGDTGFGLAAGALTSGKSYLQGTRWDGIAANYNLVLQPNGNDVEIGNGNLVIGTSGKGISFYNANAVLSDYEEGNWTPVLSDGTNNSTMGNSSSNYGRYTKVGRCVTVTCEVYVVTKGSISGSVRITGLPFTNGAGAGAYSGISTGYGGTLTLTAGQSVTGYVVPSQAYVQLTVWTATTGSTNMTAAQWNDGGALIFTATYYV